MTLLSGSTVRFAPDPAFASSLAGKRASIKVTYLDQGSGRFTVRAGGKVFEKALGATGRWQTAAFEASGDLSSISLDATSDITLHMLEVNRE